MVEELLKQLREVFPSSTYLVGGTVRDLLLNKVPKDIDLITTGEIEKIETLLKEKFKAKHFGFKKENLAFRNEVHTFLFPYKGQYWRIDVSQFEDLEKDLAHRDFTINAMAWALADSIKKDVSKIIDPFGGVKDLKRKVVKAVSLKNLEEDPLRMVRAFRIAHSLGFQIDNTLKEFVKQNYHLLKKVAKERILNEFLKGLSYHRSWEFLKALNDHRLTRIIFGTQIENPTDLWEALKKLETFIVSETNRNLKRELSFKEKTHLGEFDINTVLKLLTVYFYLTPNQRKFFRENYPLGTELTNLLEGTLKALTELKTLKPTVDSFYNYLKRYEKYLYSLGALVYTREPSLIPKYEELKNFYLGKYLKYSQPLLDGKKIMHLLGIKPSPLVGQILEKLVKAQLEGRVKDQKEAESFVKSFYGKLRG